MLNHQLYNELLQKFQQQFRREPAITAYAPGRVEVLGNHTDYNEGFVLSAAINSGTFFACAPRTDNLCRLHAANLSQEVCFATTGLEPSQDQTWSNYVKGVLSELGTRTPLPHGFDAMFLGNVPLGSGLSSSASLEMCAGLALEKLYAITLDALSLAKIGQSAEHKFAGVKCGLLDQISSLFGKTGTLVETDFRSLSVKHVPLGRNACLLLCNTHARHALVDGEYNQRRAACEEATAYFAKVLPHPVRALRDVSWQEWAAHHAGLPELIARRAAHPIGENERVRKGARLLAQKDLAGFGKLMYESHESSRTYFENSCPELDTLVSAAQQTPGVLGARLSGGGFGGSVVALVPPNDAEPIGATLSAAYQRTFGSACDVSVLLPSDGARLIAK